MARQHCAIQGLMVMPERSVDSVMSAVDHLLTGAVDSEQLPAAIDEIRQLFDGSKACLCQFGPEPGDCAVYATHVDEALEQRCFTDLAGDFIQFAQTVGSVPIGKVYRDHEVIGREKLRSSRAWQEWMAPQDMYGGLACRLAESDQTYWFLDVQRGRTQDDFDARDTALLELLFPVLRKVAEIRRHVGLLTIQRDQARGALDALALGIVIVDRELNLVYANEGADEILSDPDSAIGLRQGRLTARHQGEQRQLRRLVEDAQRSAADPLANHRSSMMMQGGSDRAHALSVCVMPAALATASQSTSGRVMVALRPMQMATDIAACARQLFDLTDTEARFASALASGMSLTEAAQAQGVRISTARTHLARIFQKTDTGQQSQLVSLLRSAALPLRPR